MFSIPSNICILLLCYLFIAPAAAFGAGDIPVDHAMNGYVWRHGDIANVLLALPVSFATSHAFTKLERNRVYFGNWLRDYSQIVDTGCLGQVPERLLRVVVSVLAFMHFGLATGEFDVTSARLGCYSHAEHIDNPKGYPSDAKDFDDRLRGPVKDEELQLDPKTGMKNYIANSGKCWETAADYIRDQLERCIERGRRGRTDKNAMNEAFLHLGGALHTLEDFAAHSNFTELCLNELGECEVFAFVGDSCRVNVPSTSNKVPPLVTGTFGMLDALQSIIGEADDKASLASKGEMSILLKKFDPVSISFDQIFKVLKESIGALSHISEGGGDILSELDQVNDAAEKAKKDPDTFNPDHSNVADGLWEAIEPAFMLHDHIAKWLLENENVFEIPGLSAASKKVDEYIDIFVYQFLAQVIEPSVQSVRVAMTIAKRTAVQLGKDAPDDVYKDGSSDSNPTHSDLAKDHYSNVLHPAAGLVATVITNWTTQEVVRCWDDLEKDAESTVVGILGVLHHPAFPESKTPIQNYMFEAVQNWWNSNSEDEKHKLRSILDKSSVMNGGNNDHTINLAYFHGKPRGFAVFKDSNPTLIPIPPRDVREDVQKMVGDAVEKLEMATKAVIETGVAQLSHTVTQAVQPVTDSVQSMLTAITDTTGNAWEQTNNSADGLAQTIVPVLQDAAKDLNGRAEDFRDAPARATMDAAMDAGGLAWKMAKGMMG